MPAVDAPLAIEARGLRKSYGIVEAVKGVDLCVRAGEVFALLGPNGAGKTTTVEILEGHRRRDGGEVRVLGRDPADAGRDWKARVGIVLQETGVEPFLTVAEVIDLHRGYYPDPRPLDEIIEIVGLEDKRAARCGTLSGGQQRRLDVAVALAGNPDLLFLDEPTTGFDPSARRSAWQMVADLQALGTTILLTTHYMDEAQHLADRVAIIVGGAIVAEGTPAELAAAARAGRARVAFQVSTTRGLPRNVRRVATIEGDHVVVETERPTEMLHAITSWAIERDIDLRYLQVTRPSLEDAYLALMEHDRS